MSDPRPTRDSLSIEAATVPNMWEMVATIEMSERRNALTRRLLWDQCL
jgi:hypothetical protein